MTEQQRRDLEMAGQICIELRGVKEQTQEICLATVRQNGAALQYVREQTPEICLAAVQKSEVALDCVRDPELQARLMEDLQNKEAPHEENEEEHIKRLAFW